MLVLLCSSREPASFASTHLHAAPESRAAWVPPGSVHVVIGGQVQQLPLGVQIRMVTLTVHN